MEAAYQAGLVELFPVRHISNLARGRTVETWKAPNLPLATVSSNEITSQSVPATTDQPIEMLSTTTSIASASTLTTSTEIDTVR